MIKTILLILCLVFMSSIAFSDDGLLAIVNNEVVTQKDLEDFINFMRMQMSVQYSEEEVEERIDQMLPDLINRLIEDRLILQAAYKENIIINPMRIKARVGQIKARYPAEADFQAAIAAQGLSLADIELKIKEQLLMRELIDRRIKSKVVVKPQEVTDYYYAHSQDFIIPEQRLVRILTIKDSDLSKEIKKTINKHEDLESIAREHSLEITDLGWVISKQLKREIADTVFNLEVGKPWPFLDQQNQDFYVFEVEAIKPPEKAELVDVQDEINGFLFGKKMQEALVSWLDELRSEAYIEIRGEHGAS